MNYGVIVAAGKSERMGPEVDKAFISLGTKPVLAYSLAAFETCPDIEGMVLVVRKDRIEAARALAETYGFSKVRKVVAGGGLRQASVWNGLSEVPEEAEIVAVHDGARPCVTADLISETIRCALRHGAGVAAVPITDTVKYVSRGHIVEKTLDRSKLWAVQTPQAFRRALLMRAFEALRKKKQTVVTDEACAVELIGEPVYLVPAPVTNIKLTTPDDLAMAAALLNLARTTPI